MKFLSFVLLAFLSLTTFAFEGLNQSASLKIFNRINCGTGVTCSRTGNGIFNIAASGAFTGDLVGTGAQKQYGFLENQISATATTITAAQCGSTFVNTGAVVINLPEASAVIGCKLTFITRNASNFDVNPDNADQILVSTNAAGDAIRNATLGNSITLQAISASEWAPVAIQGTYTDIN